MTTILRKLALTAVTGAALTLAACGGNNNNNNGNDGTPPVTSEVPASASQSIAGFIDYLMKLVVSSADMLEPVSVATVTPPTDETSEPTALP